MIKRGVFVLIIGLLGVIQLIAQTDNKLVIQLTAQTGNRIVIDDDIELIHLQDSIYIHKTWHHLEDFGRFSSNGLIMIRNGQILMIDTPMDNAKTERLVKYLEDSFSVKLHALIIGHFHDDCLGGLEYVNSLGIETIANSMTTSICKAIGLPIPLTSFTDSLISNFNGEQIECRYFGAGHSVDNITVWIASKKLLFGGCLIKSADSKGLGNLSDAVVSEWGITIEKLQSKYPEIETVIPGHGDHGGVELLTHTLRLVEADTKP